SSSNPDIPGMLISDNTRSGSCLRIAANPARPSRATLTSKPRSVSSSAINAAVSSSSSMHRIFLRSSGMLVDLRLTATVARYAPGGTMRRPQIPVHPPPGTYYAKIPAFSTPRAGPTPIMRQPRSIRFHLSLVFFLFFLLVIVLGLFSISRLTDFNRVSTGIADVWLPDTRILGDLNNFTSDFRATEGRDLLSSSASQIATTKSEIELLDGLIAQAQRGYEQL